MWELDARSHACVCAQLVRVEIEHKRLSVTICLNTISWMISLIIFQSSFLFRPFESSLCVETPPNAGTRARQTCTCGSNAPSHTHRWCVRCLRHEADPLKVCERNRPEEGGRCSESRAASSAFCGASSTSASPSNSLAKGACKANGTEHLSSAFVLPSPTQTTAELVNAPDWISNRLFYSIPETQWSKVELDAGGEKPPKVQVFSGFFCFVFSI